MVATLPRRLALRLLNEMRRQKWNVFLSYISFEMHAQLRSRPAVNRVRSCSQLKRALRWLHAGLGRDEELVAD